MFWMAFTRRELFQPGLLKLTGEVLKFLQTTSDNNHPMATTLRMELVGRIKLNKEESEILNEMTNKDILYLWCGVPGKESPYIRICELIDENKKLKEQINQNS
jgi:hypothetical protein